MSGSLLACLSLVGSWPGNVCMGFYGLLLVCLYLIRYLPLHVWLAAGLLMSGLLPSWVYLVGCCPDYVWFADCLVMSSWLLAWFSLVGCLSFCVWLPGQ